MARLIKTSDVAAKLSVTVTRFYSLRPKLEASGFPAPRAPFSNRWVEEEVDRWISAGGTSAPAGQGADRADDDASAAPLPDDDDLTGWGAKLRARAQQVNL
ncbi:helix-turn-helix transcriptional regulator [Azospirillum sp. sgz302134]